MDYTSSRVIWPFWRESMIRRENHIKDWSLDCTTIHSSSIQVHWRYSLHMAVQRVPAHSDLPQVDVESTWMIDMTTLERGVENSTLNTITSHLQTPFSMKGNKKLHGVLSGLKLIFRTWKLNLHIATIAIVWQQWCYPSYQTVSIDSTIVDTTLLSVLLQTI